MTDHTNDSELAKLPEPVAWVIRSGHGTFFRDGPREPAADVGWTPLYTAAQLAAEVEEALAKAEATRKGREE